MGRCKAVETKLGVESIELRTYMYVCALCRALSDCIGCSVLHFLNVPNRMILGKIWMHAVYIDNIIAVSIGRIIVCVL